jgi:hypothetical protein
MFKVKRKNNDLEIYLGYLEPLKLIDIPVLKEDGWFFPWEEELCNAKRITYKLFVKGSDEIQALISFEEDDGFILIHYIETAPHNFNSNRGYKVAPALISFACINSLRQGYDGFVCLHIKISPKLMRYYESLGAKDIGNQRMAFNTVASMELLDVYLYKGEW